ncbi:MAG: LacI family DNA-binding transcriptional regulator [Flavobacteriia bacterium]|nr:LacI family DNA-binding transcriptional regulator [Flavobacteriia bacterium]
MKNKKVSLQDIALATGLSKSTVSFVLNGKGDQFNINKETQKLILEKAKEMNFVPNFFAKTLREGKTKTIGLLIPDIANVFYAELSKAIQEELHKNGYNLFIVNTNDDEQFEIKLFRDLLNRSIDGLILAACNPIENLKETLNSTPIPVVFVDRFGDNFADFVGINNYQEAVQLIKRFSIKPKKLAVFYYEKDIITTIHLRIEGIQSICKKEDIQLDLINTYQNDNLHVYVKEMKKNGVDSVVCLNNKVSLEIISFLNQYKIIIPKDVRFISFDDSETFLYIKPSISALQQPIKDIGKESAHQLLSRLKEDQIPGKKVEFSCKFMARESN